MVGIMEVVRLGVRGRPVQVFATLSILAANIIISDHEISSASYAIRSDVGPIVISRPTTR